MDPKETLKRLQREIEELALKADLTPEETKDLQEKMQKAHDLKVQIEAQEQAEEARAAAIKAEAEKLAEGQIEDLKKQHEAELEKAKKEAEKAARLAPGTGAPVDDRISIEVFSPYDRLSTMDLCLRYEVMRSYGRRPSQRFWRALAGRAAKMAREEDTLYIHQGRPVKAPAIDWQVIVPKNLDLEEVDGDLFGTKAGKMDRYFTGGFDKAEDNVTPLGIKQLHEIATKANEVVYSTQASAGDEWVPTLMSAQLWREVRLNAGVLGLFEQFDMPSQPYDYPIESTDPVFYKVTETTNEAQLILTGGPFSDSKPGTGKITFAAGKLGAISYWSEEMEEDAIIAVEPQFRDQYGIKMAHTIDEVLLSGDETTGTSNVSYYGTTITTKSRFLIADGLRHEPLVTTTTDARSGAGLTVEDFSNTQKLMGTAGKYGVNPRNLAVVADPATYLTAVVMGDVLTMDKFGAAATILTGQLGSILGVPILPSEDYALTDTSGHIHKTAGNNTKGSFITVNRGLVKVGWRRRPRIRVVGLPGAEARYIVGSARFDIRYFGAGAVGMSYNLDV